MERERLNNAVLPSIIVAATATAIIDGMPDQGLLSAGKFALIWAVAFAMCWLIVPIDGVRGFGWVVLLGVCVITIAAFAVLGV